MKTIDEVIELWKDFESRATAKRSTQISRIKEDREFLSGQQWDKNDARWMQTRSSGVNVLANSVNSTANAYANYPYKWFSDNPEVDAAADAFLKSGSNARAAYDVLYSNVAFGLGYFALGSETIVDEDGTQVEIPALYSVDKVENVYFDPDSIEIDGSDAVEAAIVEFRSKNYVEAKYGSDWVTGKGVRPVVNVTDNHNPDTMCIVTYFRVEDGKCSVYRLLNHDFLEEPSQLDIERVPVFPAYGERSWDGDEVIWQGLVRKGAPVQKMLNYAFAQLAERMASAPKPVFLTTPEAVEGYDDGYRNFSKNLNPLLLWNRTSPDGKVQYEAPVRLDNQVQYGDITSIISANLELLSTITGVDAKGLMDGQPQVTATEVIYNERQSQSTIRHFYANLRDTFKAVGETVLRLMGHGVVTLDVIQGPSEYMEKQVARQELVQLAGIVPDTEKMKLVDGILLSHNDNPILRNVFGAIHSQPQPTQMEQEAFNTIEEMKNAIGQKDQQIAELQRQLEQWKQFSENGDKSTQAKFAEMQLKHQQDLESMAFKAQLEAGKDAGEAQMETMSRQMELEKQAVELDAAKAKANAEMIKADAEVAKTVIGGADENKFAY